MGFGSALYNLGIRYGNNPECIAFIDQLMKGIESNSVESSVELAITRGVYPKWEGSVWAKKGIKIRNSNLISIAPNGTLSALAGVSGGIEPEFALAYYRKTNNGNIYFYTNSIFERELRNRGLFNDQILKKVADNHGSCVGIDEIPLDMQDLFVTAHDISPEDHVYVVAEFQKYVDLSISKTINFANSATVKEISSIIELGWKTGCKGLTVYRDGCREGQTLTTSLEEPKVEKEKFIKKSRKDFGRRLSGNTYSARSGCGTFYMTLNKNPDNNQVVETFVNIKNGLCKANVEALSRMTSLAFRRGVSVEDAVDQLKGITCAACQHNGKELDGLSCPDAMARILEMEMKNKGSDSDIIIKHKKTDEEKNKIKEKKLSMTEALQKNICPECGTKLDHVSGCIQCYNCGWNKC